MPSRMLRNGDFVEAKQGNGAVPIGTVGKVVGIRGPSQEHHAPAYGVKVQWNLRKYPFTKTEWHGRQDVELLGGR